MIMENEIKKPGNTLEQYNQAVKRCRDLFEKKSTDYGTYPLMILREISLVDQIFIKLARVRTLQEKERKKEEKKVSDTKSDDIIGTINYCIIALMRRKHGDDLLNMKTDEIMVLYDTFITQIRDLMLAKNSDYGEAWRDMKQESFIDLSLAKLHRIQSIHNNNEQLLASEGVNANYHDIVNYNIFALILIAEGKHTG